MKKQKSKDDDDNLCDACGAPLEKREPVPSHEIAYLWNIKKKRWGKGEEVYDDDNTDMNEYEPTYLCSECLGSPEDCKCEKYE